MNNVIKPSTWGIIKLRLHYDAVAAVAVAKKRRVKFNIRIFKLAARNLNLG
jgi:hypothetical protein